MPYIKSFGQKGKLPTFNGYLKDCYKDGIGTEKDIQKYVYYMEQAANKQNVTSQYELALYYLNNQQADKAVTWFKKAAKQGEVGATYYYGYLMFNGQGMVQDKKGGIKLLQSAADKDFTMAYYQLGRIYYEGDGADQDYKKAVDNLRKAAERKDYNAKWLLGLCYLKGNGVKQDYYFATQLIADAAPSHQKGTVLSRIICMVSKSTTSKRIMMQPFLILRKLIKQRML